MPLGDGDEKDKPGNLCVDPIKKEVRTKGAADLSYFLPRCMDMITSEEVARRVELYFTGGALNYLTRSRRAWRKMRSRVRGSSGVVG